MRIILGNGQIQSVDGINLAANKPVFSILKESPRPDRHSAREPSIECYLRFGASLSYCAEDATQSETESHRVESGPGLAEPG